MLLITRPQPDADILAKKLYDIGYDCLVDPLLHIENISTNLEKINWREFQALVFTSAAGVRSFSHTPCHTKDLPLFAVGDATAQAAYDLGFERVTSAGKDIESLIELLISSLSPNKGKIFYGSGHIWRGNLIEHLQAHGFKGKQEILYKAHAAKSLSLATQHSFMAKKISHVLFFSPRTARIFTEILDKCDLCSSVVAVSISMATAKEIEQLNWKESLIAQEPNMQEMLALLPKPKYIKRTL